jgi:23S rRNA (cytidine1920-2'-O)/16S rRNA (cytidine1409-2'-O)-methyltransferase
MVGANNVLTIEDEAQGYVSRAALKLKHGLTQFGVSARGKNCLDIGASTVGHGQMQVHDRHVTLIEGLNARDLSTEHLDRPIHLIACDVSFISLKLALLPAMELAEEGAMLVALIKPQFEAGKDAIGKGGIVTDPQVHERVCAEVTAFLRAQGWRVLGVEPSPVEGGDGNREFLVAAGKG